MTIYYTEDFAGGHKESRALLEQSIAAYTGDGRQAHELVSAVRGGEMGKPYIEGFRHFSVSHTGKNWAVLISGHECGLDIQQGRKCDAVAIAVRIFAPEDADRVAALNEKGAGKACDEFFRLWCRREALVKATGGSVADTGYPSVMPDRVIIDGNEYCIKDISIPDLSGLYAAVCTLGEPEATDYRHL